MAARKHGLGRGLDALLGGDTNLPESNGKGASSGKVVDMLPLDLIQRGRFQPRRDFNSEKLQELADSIRQVGVLQPVLVRHLLPEEPKPLRLSQRLDSGSQADGPEPAY